MRKIDVRKIEDCVAGLCVETNIHLPEDVRNALKQSRIKERSDTAREILCDIERNIKISGEEGIPMCQDTGMTCIFLDIGQECEITGGFIEDALNEGVRRGYKEGYLRRSVVGDPVRRGNTGDNTPAHIVYRMTRGDRLKITLAPKGFGSENMSRIKMLTPADGAEGIMDFVVDTVRRAGGRPCPPIIVGVGIGSTFDGCALLAKEALLLPLDEANQEPFYAKMESEILERINQLGIGAQGFGGDTTALGVKIKTAPTHIAGMPVAVNINCHVGRHATAIL